MWAQRKFTEDEGLNITHVVILLLIKINLISINKKALLAGKSSFLRVIWLYWSEWEVACMATPSCSVSALLDSTTVFGLSNDYPGQVELESFKNCTWDISRHRPLHRPLGGDNALDSEGKLLLGRASKATVFLDIISKINSRMHALSSTELELR